MAVGKNREIIEKYPPRREYLIQMLTDLQNANSQHYLSEEMLLEVTRYTNLSKSAVMGVVEYYSNFCSSPRGNFVVLVCKSPVCINKETEQIVNEILLHFNIASVGKSSPDGLLYISYCECLGRCNEGTTVMINNEYLEKPTALNISSLIEQFIKNHPDDE